MPKKKINPSLERLVVAQHRKFPNLGIRGLSELLAKKHQIDISKSAIHKIFKKKGITQRRGPKKALSLYEAKTFPHCGLILLRCLDHQLGLFDLLRDELRVYFPRISKEMLKKIIILTSFSSLIGEKLRKSTKTRGFLRLASLSHFPAKKTQYFNKRLAQHKPIVSLKQVKLNTCFVATIKFYFNNGYCGFCDGKLSTFWDGPCNCEDFYLPLQAAKVRIEKMLADRMLIIGYTKSFDYLSLLVFKFIEGLNSGIRRIDFLDSAGKVLYRIDETFPKIALFFGYYPKIVSKGARLLTKPKKFPRFFWPEIGEFFCANTLTAFYQPKIKQELKLNNLLIKRRMPYFPDWGLLTTADIRAKKTYIAAILKKYLYLWPYISRDFLEEIEAIEKSLFAPGKNKDYLSKMLPNRLQFSKLEDFSRSAQILSIMFKEMIWGWEPKAKRGSFSLGKDHVKITLKQSPRELKKRFNKACLYLDERRAFLV